MEQLLLTLLPLLIQFGPGLIKDVVSLVQANPQQQGETDDAYIARLSPLTDALLIAAKQEDAQVEAPDTTI
jgi:hypothetical protein